MQLTKKSIRQQIITHRKNLSAKQIAIAADKLCNKISEIEIFIKASSIAAYWPHDGELSTIPLLNYSQSIEKKCYLPIIHPYKKKLLLFAEYTSQDELIKNKYGILEPNIKNASIVSPQDLSIIFLPLIAFDKSGNRLGTGGGYYDSTLKTLAHNKQKPTLIGLSYIFQEVNKIPVEPWDICLDLVITV